jgi:hypothetical protein
MGVGCFVGRSMAFDHSKLWHIDDGSLIGEENGFAWMEPICGNVPLREAEGGELPAIAEVRLGVKEVVAHGRTVREVVRGESDETYGRNLLGNAEQSD